MPRTPRGFSPTTAPRGGRFFMPRATLIVRYGGLLVLAAAACRPGDRAGATVAITDDAGRTVKVGVPAQRIVTLERQDGLV